MNKFNHKNPPKRLRISALALPKVENFDILVPNPHNYLSYTTIRNFNQYSAGQLSEYKQVMLKRWGDLVLTLYHSDSYHAIYNFTFNSNFRNRLRGSDLGVSKSLNN